MAAERPTQGVGSKAAFVPVRVESLNRRGAFNHIVGSIGDSHLLDRDMFGDLEKDVSVFKDRATWAYRLTPDLVVVSSPKDGTSIRRFHPMTWGVSEESLRGTHPLTGEIPFQYLTRALIEINKLNGEAAKLAEKYDKYKFQMTRLSEELAGGKFVIKKDHITRRTPKGEGAVVPLTQKQRQRKLNTYHSLYMHLPERMRDGIPLTERIASK